MKFPSAFLRIAHFFNGNHQYEWVRIWCLGKERTQESRCNCGKPKWEKLGEHFTAQTSTDKGE